MTTIETVRAAFGRNFHNVVEVGNGIVRGERQHNGRPYAVAYVDLSDEVVKRAHELQSYQERLIGADFFSPDSDLRWNSYLFFWAGPKSAASKEYQEAKRRIELDRHFARKFVLNGNDLESRLGRMPQVVASIATQDGDAGLKWSSVLSANSLSMLLEQRPRTTTLALIENGEAFKTENSTPIPMKAGATDVLGNGMLRKLSIQKFRRVHEHKEFQFGDVNLITAPNGMGKTSLLEAIEALYCGRVRRDPDAIFEGITGVVEAQDGQLHTVNLTNVPSTLKARNMSWYGRTEVQGQAISQGFTRFNFLDTDAAFRMSSEDDPQQIQLDLSRLIVGPDTTRLWTFLYKLKEDVNTRFKAIKERQPVDQLSIDVLDEEVRRLKSTPSEFSNLLISLQESINQLQPKWATAEGTSLLTEQVKASLLKLRSAAERAVSHAPITPSNKINLEAHLVKMKASLAEAKRIQSAYEKAIRDANAAAETQKEYEEKHRLARVWEQMLIAGVPQLAARISSGEQQVQSLRDTLASYQEDAIATFPQKYLLSTVKDGLSEAIRESELAQEASRTASRALIQAQELGQTLVELKRDLHDASVAVMGQTGSLTKCPVCKTTHTEQELAEKLQALIGTGDSQITTGLKQRAQTAKHISETAQRALMAMQNLAKWQQAAGLEESLKCNEIFTRLEQRHKELKAAIIELQEAKQAEKTLAATGTRLEGWQEARSNAQRALSGEFDINDSAQVHKAIELMVIQNGLSILTNTLTRKTPNTLLTEATKLSISIGVSTGTPMSPSQMVVAIERLVMQTETSVAAAEEIEKTINWPAAASHETLLSQIQSCLLNYDQAVHAATQKTQADSQLTQKVKELDMARDRSKKLGATLENLAHAASTLSKIVDEHSLEDITSETLKVIRNRVSYVFSQIHSPQEYELGDLEHGQLIVRRDDGAPHAVNQVSTGQRAALALSIFLALNESASTAPPIVLIDDPVAHIDDLNALSFLDYLRELVVSNRKQVFFATADVRLAALFQRKFEFLGPERYKQINLDTHKVTAQ